MDETPKAQIGEILDIVREGLAEYLSAKYEAVYGKLAAEEMRLVVREHARLDFTDRESLLPSLDIQACLDLILRRKDVFNDDIGYTGLAHASEIAELRKVWAHHRPASAISVKDLPRAADTGARLLRLAKQEVLADQLDIITEELLRQRYGSEDSETSGEISEAIRVRFEKARNTITMLTKEQYQVIRWLQGHPRAAIGGCAGSGKTLVAAERAIRLAGAGVRTLLLCHSRQLAIYLGQLTTGTGVRTSDFVSWVRELNSSTTLADSSSWTVYSEPTEQELEQAFDGLSASALRYDAIIVDEGQDFRDTWWVLVEAALSSQSSSFFSIFYDDNQALLPRRSSYPVEQAPFTLSRNCRNAGEVFEFVNRFHPQAPEPSLLLAKQGIFKHSTFHPGTEIETVTEAVTNALQVFSPAQIAVLTTEPDPTHQSVLHRLAIDERVDWRWQDGVMPYLHDLSRRLRSYHSAGPPTETRPPALSDNPYPTQADVRAVASFARAYVNILGHTRVRSELARVPKRHKWALRQNGISLSESLSPLGVAAFLQSEAWADSIPKPSRAIIMADDSGSPDTEFPSIRLCTVSEFKGLEADAVVLFIRSARDGFEAHAYVGASRARLFLHLVTDTQTSARLPLTG